MSCRSSLRQRIEHRERLVEQQQLRLEREGARERHALLRSERELARQLVAASDTPTSSRYLADVSAAGRRRHPAKLLPHREQHVVLGAEPGEQRRRLEHHRPISPRLGRLPAVDDDAALGGLLQTGDDRQHGRFPAARVSQDADELRFLDLDVDVLDRDDRTGIRREDLGEARELERDNEAHTATA